MSLQTAERSSALDASENPIYQRHLIAYQQASTLISGSVLEVGCGEGYGIPILAPTSNDYLAIDKFATGVAQLPANAQFRQMTIPPLAGMNDASFDFVVTFQVIEHIENDDLFVKEIHRVLKKGGKLILTTPNREMSLTRNPWHVREYDIDQMQSILKKYFSHVDLKGVFGNEKVMDYYEKNKASVQKFTRFDILNLQYKLPRWALQIPYDIANRMNRRMLKSGNQGLVSDIVSSDYFIAPSNRRCLDWFAICTK